MNKTIVSALWLGASSAFGAIGTVIPENLPETPTGAVCAQKAADLVKTYAEIFRFPVYINEVRLLSFESGIKGDYNFTYEAKIQLVNFHHGIPFEFLNGKARFVANWACDNLKIETINHD